MPLMNDLVRASLDAQGVPATETRAAEIAIEAERLAKGVSRQRDRLSYYDEPSQFAVLLMSAATHG